MNEKLAKLVVALLFLSVLIVSNGQNRLSLSSIQKVRSEKRSILPPLMPELGPYGNLVGLKDANGYDVFERKPRPWREGYVIAYRVKKPYGLDKERIVYVIGDRVTRRNLKIENQKSTNSKKVVTTSNKVLEISRSVTWDENSNALRSDIVIKNVGTDELILKAIEFEIDERMVVRLIEKAKFAKLFDSVALNPECPLKAGACMLAESSLPRDDQPTADCPGCPCGEHCHPDSRRARGFWRKPMNSKRAFAGDPIAGKIPLFRESMLGLSWAAGSNLAPSTLKPGEQIGAQYGIIISQP